MNTCENPCATCPYLQLLDERIADRDEARQESLTGITELMATDQHLADLRNELASLGSPQVVTSAEKQSGRKYAQKTENLFNLLEVFDAQDETQKQVAQETCHGPETKRRFILFGRTVIRCTTKHAISLPAEWTRRTL